MKPSLSSKNRETTQQLDRFAQDPFEKQYHIEIGNFKNRTPLRIPGLTAPRTGDEEKDHLWAMFTHINIYARSPRSYRQAPTSSEEGEEEREIVWGGEEAKFLFFSNKREKKKKKNRTENNFCQIPRFCIARDPVHVLT